MTLQILIEKMLKFILLLWAPVYCVGLVTSLAVIAYLINQPVLESYILVFLFAIICSCLVVTFFTYLKFEPLINFAKISVRAKIIFKAILYLLPWAAFLFTLSLPSIFLPIF